MSFLFVKPAGAKLNDIRFMLEICSKEKHNEIGVVCALDGVIHRRVGYKSVLELIGVVPDKGSAIIYANNSFFSPSEADMSPLYISKDIAFCCCGNFLSESVTHLRKSNNKRTLDFLMIPLFGINPSTFDSKPVQWMIEKTLRPFCSMAFLRSDGKIIVLNEKNLTHHSSGSMFMNFDWSKNTYLARKSQAKHLP